MKTITLDLLKQLIEEVKLSDNIGDYLYINDLMEYIEERNV